jgi:hypothetical protein
MKKRIGHDSIRLAEFGLLIAILLSTFAAFGQQTGQLPTP